MPNGDRAPIATSSRGERLLVVATRGGLGRLLGPSAAHPDGESTVDSVRA